MKCSRIERAEWQFAYRDNAGLSGWANEILTTEIVSILCPEGGDAFFVQWSKLADFEKVSTRFGHTVDTAWTQARYRVPDRAISKAGQRSLPDTKLE